MVAEAGKEMMHARRIDQLLSLLMETFREYYLYKLDCEKVGPAINPGLEKRIGHVCRRAALIGDTQVQLPREAGAEATVTSDAGVVHHIRRPDSAHASCTCSHFARGEVCKHIIKASTSNAGLPSTFLA